MEAEAKTDRRIDKLELNIKRLEAETEDKRRENAKLDNMYKDRLAEYDKLYEDMNKKQAILDEAEKTVRTRQSDIEREEQRLLTSIKDATIRDNYLKNRELDLDSRESDLMQKEKAFNDHISDSTQELEDQQLAFKLQQSNFKKEITNHLVDKAKLQKERDIITVQTANLDQELEKVKDMQVEHSNRLGGLMGRELSVSNVEKDLQNQRVAITAEKRALDSRETQLDERQKYIEEEELKITGLWRRLERKAEILNLEKELENAR